MAPNRWDLEDAWRARLQEKQAAYESAMARYRLLVNATSEAHSLGIPGSAVAEAEAAAAQATEEFARALCIFTELAVNGNALEESMESEAFGA